MQSYDAIAFFLKPLDAEEKLKLIFVNLLNFVSLVYKPKIMINMIPIC